MTSEPDVRIGVPGRIIAGEDVGATILVKDDNVNTGGFLILVGQAENAEAGYDGWVEDRDHLVAYFKEAGWSVAWADADDQAPA